MTKHTENKTIEEIVKDIMQSGFDVAMGGDPFHDPEENKRILDEKYDRVVSEYTQVIQKQLDLALKQRTESLIEEIFDYPGSFGKLINRNSPFGKFLKSKYLKQEVKEI